MRFQLRNVVILIAAFVLTPITWMVLFSDADLSENTLLEQRLAELRDRLHYAESLNQGRENEIQMLRNQLKVLLANTHSSVNGPLLDPRLNLSSLYGNMSHVPSALGTEEQNQIRSSRGDVVLPQEARDLLANLSQSGADISTPGIYHYLPHLLGKPSALKPSFKLSRGRTGVSVVLGVPTIKRDRESYLMQTLDSLINNLNDAEKDDCVIILFVAEPHDLDYVRTIAKEVDLKFKEHLTSGLLEVVAPSGDFYPSFDNLKVTFGDPLERVKWRTKQNLDFCYLMMYARTKGTYYVQLEDDIISKTNYMSTMKNFATQQQVDDWLLLEYSKLGFIGKLFKSRDLPLVVEFFLMFHRDKPIDWLLDHLLFVKVCNPEKDRKHCQHSIAELRRRFKPSLFQHIGTHSSLKGKVQKLKDKDFGKNIHVQAHLNPNAEVSTTLKVYQKFSLDRAYMGETFFWGLIPHAGDTLNFKFNPPVIVDKYLLRSGNAEHPGDKFYNTTVEVLPADHILKEGGILSNNQNNHHGKERTQDGFLVLSRFSHDTGMVSGVVGEEFGPIDTMRLRVLTESESWVILSEIMISPKLR